MQHSAHLLMIQPVRFEYNTQTAANNSFQTATDARGNEVQQKAQQEFDAFIELLRAHDIDITVVKDTAIPHTPDSVFPNNWISFHDPGIICLQLGNYVFIEYEKGQDRKRPAQGFPQATVVLQAQVPSEPEYRDCLHIQIYASILDIYLSTPNNGPLWERQ